MMRVFAHVVHIMESAKACISYTGMVGGEAAWTLP